jgi:hypothetical protein
MQIKKFGKKALVTSVLVVGVTTFGVAGAQAATLQELLNSLVKVNNAIQSVKSVADSFSGVITNLSGYTDVQSIVGLLGQFIPKETAQAVEKPNASDPSGKATFGITAQATTDLAANQVLSKEGQAATQEVQTEIVDLNTASKDVSDVVFGQAQDVQGLNSTQDVLKVISKQLSGQADINAAQVRLGVLQNNSTQSLLTQLAAANLTNASNEARAISKERSALVADNSEMQALARSLRFKFADDGN